MCFFFVNTILVSLEQIKVANVMLHWFHCSGKQNVLLFHVQRRHVARKTNVF